MRPDGPQTRRVREQITRRSTLPRPRSVLQRIGRDSPKSAALSTELRAHGSRSKRAELSILHLATAIRSNPIDCKMTLREAFCSV